MMSRPPPFIVTAPESSKRSLAASVMVPSLIVRPLKVLSAARIRLPPLFLVKLPLETTPPSVTV